MYKRIFMAFFVISVLVVLPVFLLLVYAGMSYFYAALLAFCAGMTTGYFAAKI